MKKNVLLTTMQIIETVQLPRLRCSRRCPSVERDSDGVNTVAIGAMSCLWTEVTVEPSLGVGLTKQFMSNPRVIKESREMVRGKVPRLRLEALWCCLHGPPRLMHTPQLKAGLNVLKILSVL